MKFEISGPSDQQKCHGPWPSQRIKIVWIACSVQYFYNFIWKFTNSLYSRVRLVTGLALHLTVINPPYSHTMARWMLLMVTRGYASGVGLIHMHKKQPRHFDCGLQVIKVVKIIYSVIWKSYLKRGLEKNWFKALVWPLQKVLEMLQSKKKMKKIQTPPSRQRGLGQKLPGVQNHHPNSTGSKRRQECQTMPACLLSLSYPTPVLHLSSISSLWMETKDFLQQAVAHWDGWPACILEKQMAYTNLINISIS